MQYIESKLAKKMNGNTEKTHLYDDKIDHNDERTARIDPDRSAPAQGEPGSSHDEYDARTTLMDELPSSDDQELTRIIGTTSRRKRRAPSPVGQRRRQNAMDDPPAGWLVVVNGPGKGNVLTLGYGMNSIGRARDERVCIDFGDEQISRRRHANVTYDSRGRKFYVQQGGGTNLVYMEDEVVLTPKELPPYANLLIGETTLRFVPLCGEYFDWHGLSD